MKKIVTFNSTDSLILHGIYYDHGFDKSVVHIHGLAGNFYSSSYHVQLVAVYKKLGYNYLSFNNRGAEYVKQLKNSETGKSKFYGYTNELFDEADLDIQGAVQFLKNQNIKNFILQGHSSGCQKIIYSVAKHQMKFDRIILLSPCDDIGLAIEHYSKEVFDRKIKKAMISKKGLLPDNFFFDLPISPATFLSHFGPDNKFDIFHYYQPERDFEELKKNRNETLVVFGEHDYVSDFEIVKKVYKDLTNYSFSAVSGAGHKYLEYEDKLAELIYNYVVRS